MELVFFSIMGDCVCKIVCQFFGMGSDYFWVCLFLGWWLLVLGLFFGSCVRFGSGFVSWGLCLVLGLSVCGFVSM